MIWVHGNNLFSDFSRDELTAFALAIDCRRSDFIDEPGTCPFYQLSRHQRDIAEQMGARRVIPGKLHEVTDRARKRGLWSSRTRKGRRR